MRLGLPALALSAISLAACSVEHSVSWGPSDDEPLVIPSAPAPAPTTPPPSSTVASPEVAPKEGAFAEVVYVFMRDATKGQWFCTGTLVSKTTVVTAAHCLDTSLFVSYEVVAPGAAGKPRVKATRPASFGGHYDEVANPDIGVLELSTPIAISAYAELTDVTERVAAGDAITAAAVVRTAETPQAPLALSAHVPVSSTVDLGYEHGFGTPMFTKGGDSGAGLFLVENGKLTHKLIGVARQPEPSRNLDHFTRVDAEFLAWFQTTTGHGS